MQLRDFLDIDDLDAASLRGLIDFAKELKSKRNDINYHPLKGKKIALIFEKPSTRTRVSFEVGMLELGGHVVMLNHDEIQLGRGETIADTARVLSRYVDIIMLRTYDHKKLLELAEYAEVPVINGLSDFSHPCQIMADIMTFEEKKGNIKGKTIAWLGDCNNVTASWIQAAASFGFKFNIAAPKSMQPEKTLIKVAAEQGAKISISEDVKAAVKNADAVVTDCWVSMGQEKTLGASGVKKKLSALKKYQVTESVMNMAAKNAIFLHCLPAHRGEEVTTKVIDGKTSAVWDEAENRLHAQKAIIMWCLNKVNFGSKRNNKKIAF